MEDFTLPTVGARFKKKECWRPILPNARPIQKTPKFFFKETKKIGKRGLVALCVRLRTRAGRRPMVTHQPHVGFFFSMLSSPFFLILPLLLGTLVNSTSLAPLDSKVHEHLKYGRYSRGDPIFWFFYFRPLHDFFDIFLQNWNLWPWFSLGAPILGSHSIGRGSLIFEEGPTNHTIGTRFFHSGLSRI